MTINDVYVKRGIGAAIILLTIGFALGAMIVERQEAVYYLSFFFIIVAEVGLLLGLEFATNKDQLGHWVINVGIMCTLAVYLMLSIIIAKIAYAQWTEQLVVVFGLNVTLIVLVGVTVALFYSMGIQWQQELDEEKKKEESNDVQRSEMVALG